MSDRRNEVKRIANRLGFYWVDDKLTAPFQLAPTKQPGTKISFYSLQVMRDYLAGVEMGMELHAPDCDCGRLACSKITKGEGK